MNIHGKMPRMNDVERKKILIEWNSGKYFYDEIKQIERMKE